MDRLGPHGLFTLGRKSVIALLLDRNHPDLVAPCEFPGYSCQISRLVCSEQVAILNIELSFQEHKDYLFVHIRGAKVPPDVCAALLAIREKVKQTGHTRILIDGMG